MSPTTNNEYPVQKTVFDLESCEKVTLVKSYTFIPAATVQEALERLMNDHDALLNVVNSGLRDVEQTKARNSADGWFVEPEDDEDEKVPFTGSTADAKKVNSLVLTLAKLQGFAKGISREKKKAIKAAVLETIKNTPALRTMLQGAAESASE
jgi:hypothetical protein